jgi:DNA-binding NarL/FixJ family response regulator
MTVTQPIRVALVDDQELVRTGFRMILETEPGIDVVVEAKDGQDAIERIPAAKVDVVLMDIRMPRMDGVEATTKLVELDGPRVIILTTFDLDEYVFAALQGGASGFLLKDTPAEDLINAIRVVASGDALLAPSVTRRLIRRYQESSSEPTVAAEIPGLDQLTQREVEVMSELAKGYSNAEIGQALFVSETTVKTHVGRVLTKLGLRDRVQVVVAAYESGMVLPGHDNT